MPLSSEITAAVVGGALTLSGTITSQFFGLFSGRIERQHNTQVRRKHMLEKMVDLIAESQPWFQKLKLCRRLSDLQQSLPPHEPRTLLMLARLSFPSLVDIAEQWAASYVDYYHFAVNCFRPDGTAIGAQLEVAAASSPVHQTQLEAVNVLRNSLENAIAEEAKKYQDL